MADHTAPTLTSLVFSTYAINLANGPVQLTITGRGTDNVGITDLSIDFSANGGFNFLGGTESLTGFPDSWADGQSSETVTVPTNQHDGTYTIAGVVVFDAAGNQGHYTTAQLQALGIQTTITVSHADNTGPTLTALNLPSIVAPGQQLTIGASATDPSGVQRVVIEFDKNLTGSGGVFDIFGNTDSWADGSSASTISVPLGTPNGVYTIKDIVLTDNGSNSTTLTTAQLAAAGFHTTITVSNADTTPPSLTSLIFPTTIDLSTGDKNVTFNASATDNASGIQDVTVHFDRDFVNGTSTPGVLDINGGNGDSWSDGASSLTDTVFHSTPSSGVYNITSVDVKDGAGNVAHYTPSQLQANGIATSLTVIPGQASSGDHTPPHLNDITFPGGINTSNGNAPLTITISDGDDSSGVSDVIIWLDQNIQLSNGLAGGFDIGTLTQGTWFVSNSATPGVYAIREVDVFDHAGNESIYSSSDLASLGISWGFFLYDNSFNVSSNNVISGTLFDDVLNATFSNCILFGGAGNDLFVSAGGLDWFYGGIGDDTYVVDSVNDIIVENANEGIDTVQTGLSVYVLTSFVEDLTFTGFGSFSGFGNSLDNVIIGGASADVLDGVSGVDTLIGGDGSDLYFVENSSTTIFESVSEGFDSVISYVTYTLSDNIEAIYTVAGGGATGNSLDNLLDGAYASTGQTLDGGGGNDIIYGTIANDLLIGGAGSDALYDIGGNDTMQGGSGDDAYFVSSAFDIVQENAAEGTDTIYASVNFTLPANVEVLVPYGAATRGDGNDDANVLLGVAGDHGLTLDGHGGNDVIYGSNFDDTLIGGAGDDLLWGFGGSDTMQGGTGNDVYIVEQAGDVVQENPGEGNDTIYASVNITLPTNVENLFVYGGATSGSGNALDNFIVNEFITSGVTLTGGGGNDTFVFIPGTANNTTITDFFGNGAGVGDVLEFAAYGAGASFAKTDATHGVVTYNGGASHDTITFTNSPTIDIAHDVLFV